MRVFDLLVVLFVSLVTFLLVPGGGISPAEEQGREKQSGPAKEFTNSIGMRFVLIPPGKFLMGSQKTEVDRDESEYEHQVEITRHFYMGVYEVTQEEYEKVTGKKPSLYTATGKHKDDVKGIDTRRFPVEMVPWENAVKFCDWLTDLRQEKRLGRKYRLPTEAEWEYACRGGASERGPFYFKEPSRFLGVGQANFWCKNPYECDRKGEPLRRTAKVGAYEPNDFGLYDMHGNVWEWCQDVYDDQFYHNSPRQDPKKISTDLEDLHVYRGGSYGDGGANCRAACRRFAGRELYSHHAVIGFRVVCTDDKIK